MSTRDKLLLMLKNNQDTWISGENLRKDLGISRNAVSKHMKILREQGYDINSATNKGYRLSTGSDVISPHEIKQGLLTHVMGKQDIVCFKETESTNTEAKHLANKGALEGTVVIAENQISGRGRLGRSWFSPKGKGIFLSVIVRPRLSPMEAAGITLMTAVALAETLISETGITPTIKWPNDILVNNKKLAGILTELSTDMDVVNHLVVGVGLNVNTRATDFPDDIKPIATSVYEETGKTWPRKRIIQLFLKEFEKFYTTMVEGNFQAIMERWKELSCITGKEITVNMINSKITGKVLDVDMEGVLILKESNGTVHRILSGDIIL